MARLDSPLDEGEKVRSKSGQGKLQQSLTNSLRILVFSNLITAVGSAGIAFTTLILADLPLLGGPVFIAFTMPLFVYTVNRFTDREEDEQTVPHRVAFIRTYGTALLAVSSILYLGGLWLAQARNFETVIFTTFPVVIGLVYSVSRLKYILFVKDVIVGLSWGMIPLLVAAYAAHPWTHEILLLALFFSSMITVSTIVFDVKDIEGDRAAGIRTLPNVYGLRWTQLFCHALNGSVALGLGSLVLSGVIPSEFVVLMVVNLHVFGYLFLADPDRGPLYYGGIVEGEYLILTIIVGGLHLLR